MCKGVCCVYTYIADFLFLLCLCFLFYVFVCAFIPPLFCFRFRLQIPRPVRYEHVAVIDPVDSLPTTVLSGFTEDGEPMRFSQRTRAPIPLSPDFEHEDVPVKVKPSAAEGVLDTHQPEVSSGQYVLSALSFEEEIYAKLGTGRALMQGDGGYFYSSRRVSRALHNPRPSHSRIIKLKEEGNWPLPPVEREYKPKQGRPPQRRGKFPKPTPRHLRRPYTGPAFSGGPAPPPKPPKIGVRRMGKTMVKKKKSFRKSVTN